jgi:hypothetical protein
MNLNRKCAVLILRALKKESEEIERLEKLSRLARRDSYYPGSKFCHWEQARV